MARIQEHSVDFRAVIGQYVKILGKGLPHVLEKNKLYLRVVIGNFF